MLISFQAGRDINDLNSFLIVEDQGAQREFNCPDLQALRTGATSVSVPFPVPGSQ